MHEPSEPTVVEDTRERLLRIGLERARSQGLRALTVRGVAREANVNLGSFVHHFGTRDAFVGEVIEAWYRPFYGRLEFVADIARPPFDRLRTLVAQVVEFLVENRAFIVHVIADAAAGEPGAREFVRSMARRHPALLIASAAQAIAAGHLPPSSPLKVVVFLMMSAGGPVLWLTGLGQGGIVPREFQRELDALAADRDAALERLDWALAGLATTAERSSARHGPAGGAEIHGG